MKKLDKSYEVKLNFTDEFNLNRNGMIKEIKIEFDIIRLCFQELGDLGEQYDTMLDRILVMPLRKLLCENNSVLLQVCPDFKMPPLIGTPIKLMGEQIMVRPPFEVAKEELWLPVEDWLNQIISRFDRNAESTVTILPKHTYDGITKRLNARKLKNLKPRFESLYVSEETEYKGKVSEVYFKVDPNNASTNQEVFDILDQIGYNQLTIYDFIKHLSDKRGAHIDIGHSPVIGMVNQADVQRFTPVHYFAAEMIYAAKKQIPELSDYWVEMPDLLK